MDPIKLPPTSQRMPPGYDYLVPFRGQNPRFEDGTPKADFTLAQDLPLFKTQEEAHHFLMNTPEMHSQIIEYRGHSVEEMKSIPGMDVFLKRIQQ
jgi:hypothetical protein